MQPLRWCTAHEICLECPEQTRAHHTGLTDGKKEVWVPELTVGLPTSCLICAACVIDGRQRLPLHARLLARGGWRLCGRLLRTGARDVCARWGSRQSFLVGGAGFHSLAGRSGLGRFCQQGRPLSLLACCLQCNTSRSTQ